MPILDVEVVVAADESLPPDLAQKLADLAGAILDSTNGGTWVKLRTLPLEHYAENRCAEDPGNGEQGQGDGLTTPRPVFVSILLRQRPAIAERREQADNLATAFATACNRPKENIHILYQESAAARIAFGGKLLIDE